MNFFFRSFQSAATPENFWTLTNFLSILKRFDDILTSGNKGLLHTSSSQDGVHVWLSVILRQPCVELLQWPGWWRHRCTLPLRRLLRHARRLILCHLWRVVRVSSSLRLCITSWALLLSLGTAIRPGHSFADDPLPWRFFETLRQWSVRGIGAR